MWTEHSLVIAKFLQCELSKGLECWERVYPKRMSVGIRDVEEAWLSVEEISAGGSSFVVLFDLIGKLAKGVTCGTAPALT